MRLNLKSFHFDEFFESIDDEDVTGLVVVGDVAGVKPPVRDRLGRRLLVVQVTQHYLGIKFNTQKSLIEKEPIYNVQSNENN